MSVQRTWRLREQRSNEAAKQSYQTPMYMFEKENAQFVMIPQENAGFF